MKRNLTKLNTAYFLTISMLSIAILATMRFIGLFGSLALKPLLPAGFVLMFLLPIILLSKPDRMAIGLQRAAQRWSYLKAVGIGGVLAFIVFLAGILLFGHNEDNWYITILNSYRSNQIFSSDQSVGSLFLIFTVPAVIFSPIGEELFFRGFLQNVLTLRVDKKVATWIECALFGTIHLMHHGIYRTASGFDIHIFSGLLWAICMTGVAWVFASLRLSSKSIYPAMLAHASFNFFMNYFIFYHLY